jgi:dTMP kinase
VPDRFESERRDFFERVAQAYRDIAAAEPLRVRQIDADREPESIAVEVRRIIDDYVALQRG